MILMKNEEDGVERILSTGVALRAFLPSLPLPVWMMLIAILFGLACNMPAPELIGTFNDGFGRALGEFALILLPSFTLAAAMEQQQLRTGGLIASAAAPFAGAGMICPDTAFAALSPIAGSRKLEVAFGAYSGFKLLYPAGPLIVATGLGIEDDGVVMAGVALLFPVWAAGLFWARMSGTRATQASEPSAPGAAGRGLLPLLPFGILAGLLIVGATTDLAQLHLLDYATRPKGALLIAALSALAMLESDKWRPCLDAAVRRTGSLLFLIGSASALGVILTANVSIAGILPNAGGLAGILGLFLLSALFKLLQGSSMATFAAVAPVAAPIVADMALPGIASVYAICLGSLVAILPNDSFYWLARSTCFDQKAGPDRSLTVLATGSLIQALTGFGLLAAALSAGLL